MTKNTACVLTELTEGEVSEAGSLNKISCLAPALGVAMFIIVADMILVTLCCAT
jgi:hypothetical protein